MTITQTVDIPDNRRLIIDVPHEVPIGRTNVIIQFPVKEETPIKKRMTEEEEKEWFKHNAEWLYKEAIENISFQSMYLDN
jgi:hypothetical protein